MPLRDPRLTILIVSCNPSVREGFCRALAGQQFHVLPATCGEQALDLIERYEPDLIITELHRSWVHGWNDFLQEKHFRADHPVFVITALPTERTHDADLLATEFFQEPLDIEPVLAALRSHLRPSHSTQPSL